MELNFAVLNTVQDEPDFDKDEMNKELTANLNKNIERELMIFWNDGAKQAAKSILNMIAEGQPIEAIKNYTEYLVDLYGDRNDELKKQREAGK